MSKIRLGSEDIQVINLFEKITKAKAEDLVEHEGTLCFLVRKEDMGMAIGKKGANIEKVRNALGKNVQILEYSDNQEEFIKNIFHPAEIQAVRVSKSGKGDNVVVTTEKKNKKIVIGPGGSRIKLARRLLDRYFNLKDVIIEAK
jgi:N utilization substance protein A